MKYRVLVEITDMERDGSPEIFFYHYGAEATGLNDFDFAIYASSTEQNGRYDNVANTENADADGDGDGDVDKYDKKLYLQVADAFAQFKQYRKKA